MASRGNTMCRRRPAGRADREGIGALDRAVLRAAMAAAWVVLVALASARATRAADAEPAKSLWNLDALSRPPAATWGEWRDGAREVYYEGEPFDGRPTRVFAYYAKPSGEGPFPAMVLVHGGGGTAFAEWAKLWADRGYAAIAMDLAGRGPNRQRLANGGPDQEHSDKFQPLADDEQARRLWTYHAVAAVVRAHSLVRSLGEVDAERTGLTGISWGGYLVCIVAGLDHRFKVAVPVYGCGFLHENSCWLGEFERLGPEATRHWVERFDPSRYLGAVRCPIFFLNGTNDFAYPLDSYRKSYRLVPGRVDLRIEVRMPHGHPQGWAPKEIGLYVDSVLRGGEPLPRLGPIETRAADGDGRIVAARFESKTPVVSAALSYTLDQGRWQDRRWETIPAELSEDTAAARLPDGRPIVYYLSVTDRRGAMVTTEHAELP